MPKLHEMGMDRQTFMKRHTQGE
eukprot:COSAG06_NODE_35528_length_459_cov_0.716667_1_plen_22_part_10